MAKTWTVLVNIVLISFVILVLGGAWSAAEKAEKLLTEAPEVVVIDTPGYKKDKKGPVNFQHKKHQEEYKKADGKTIECAECHHNYVYEGDAKEPKNVWKEGDPVKKCSSEGCHSPLKKQKKISKLNVAFHKNCKDCHKAVVEAGLKKDKEAPFKSCKKCMGSSS
jgi:formate-dependent nitrite reductase cytochrome c552 subunit